MTAKTLLIPFDSSGFVSAIAIDWIRETPVAINRGEPVIIHAAFFDDGVIVPNFTNVISIVCDITKQGSTELLARAHTESFTVKTQNEWIAGGYNCTLEFTGAGTANCSTGTLGHDTFLMTCYATTSTGNIALGYGLFTVFGQVSLSNPALPIDSLPQLYLQDQAGNTRPVRINSEDGLTLQIGDEI